ncbi:MAG: formylglycine-generating enzyme family protein [Candidatus Coatesbacteria bacterium]|nr:formylglycine-generating enzyme family protein [Candidatus Coatesbacteria bacterium]
MRYPTTVAAFLVLIASSAMCIASPTIEIYTDAGSYQSGDTLELALSAQNDDQAMSVDVYVGIILTDGKIWSTQWDGWRHLIEPWIADIYVPAWFEMGRTPYWTFDLPSSAPPIEDDGDYAFAALLTYTGTFDWVANASLAPFSYAHQSSTEITMVSIPAGSFSMGSPDYEEGRWDQEGPQRTVNISAFLMSETEITEKQWEDVVGWNHCYHKRGDNYPVEYVTWYDCLSFCNKLSEADGYTNCYTMTGIVYTGSHITSADVTWDQDANGYRLPTEAEWEYACRAGTTTRFYTGDSDGDLGGAGWYMDNSGSQKHEVRQKAANAWGLYDMHGNVYEWCWDWYSFGYYGDRPDPDSDPTGPDSGTHRISRGGSWDYIARYCRSACRVNLAPDSLYYGVLGFRVVRQMS